MGIFLKFKCWGCDEIPCTCTKVEIVNEEELETETTTLPKLELGDIAVQDGADWIVKEIQDGIAIGKRATFSGTTEYRRLHEPYRKLLSATRAISRRR